jgi:adenine-specific DNA-methyltransferase
MTNMAKIDITKTELVWPGKYNENGTLKEVPRVRLPFQIIETVNESRATREVREREGGSLFDTYKGTEGDTFEDGWKNKLIWGDNLLVMGSLLEKFAGKVDLIYIDPPFATGADFTFTTEIGETGEEITKEQSVIEEKAYRDTWGAGVESFLGMLRDRIALMRTLLSQKGVIVVHCDWRMSHRVRMVLDELFGMDAFLNNVVWVYGESARGAKAIASQFPRNHDDLLCYRSGGNWTFNGDSMRRVFSVDEARQKGFRQDEHGRWFKTAPRGDYTDESIARLEAAGRIHMTSTGGVRIKYFLPVEDGKVVELVPVGDSWMDIPDAMHMPEAEQTGYATQKPEALLARVVRAFSSENDIVADLFCGSGTTLAVAEKLGRRWIGCDLGRWGIHVTRKRLLGIENCRPFDVLNLGKYERQYWQGVTFAGAKDKPTTEQALYEYLAFVLKLYGAQPLAGMSHIHGQKGKAMVHVGAVDAPVTIDEISAAVDECAKLKQRDLHVLGWEWEMGLYDLMVEAAKRKGVKLLLLQIPREVMEQQAAAKGDVHFFELAYLEAEIKQSKKLMAQVRLKDFVIPNTDLIPEDVRSKVKTWSDYVDYWAVDWDFQNDTFMQGWVAYRTRKERKLPLTSDSHTYEKSGKYRILVKIIDIFGNDTTQAFDVEMK